MKDRALWLLIDSAGRNTPYWEVAGAHGHYLWERKAVSATEKPHVEEVVSALREELDAMLFSKDQKDRIWAQQGAVPVALVPAPRKELARSTERPSGRMAKR